MATLNAVPGTVDVHAYGGDTLTIAVTAPSSLVTGREWKAQVKSTRDSDVPDAVFTITPPTVPDGPAYLVLPAADTRRLLTTVTRLTLRPVPGGHAYLPSYTGVWDVQISGTAGADPVTTLAQGSITITLDVTREVAP